MQRCAVWLCASGPDVGGGSLFMERVWVLRDWAKVLISQRFCSSLWMKSGIGREVETCPLSVPQTVSCPAVC